MKSAANTSEKSAPGVTAGIDWACQDHAVAIVDHTGRQTARFTVKHDAAGLREQVASLRSANVGEAAIERPDGPIVDALLADRIGVVVISPAPGRAPTLPGARPGPRKPASAPRKFSCPMSR